MSCGLLWSNDLRVGLVNWITGGFIGFESQPRKLQEEDENHHQDSGGISKQGQKGTTKYTTAILLNLTSIRYIAKARAAASHQ